MTIPRCGTRITLEEFFEGWVSVDVVRNASHEERLLTDAEVPVVDRFDALCENLRKRTVSEIVAILGTRKSRELYGEPESVLRNVAYDLEETDPNLALRLHVRNWEEYRDADSLSRAVTLAFRTGLREEGSRLAQIARHADKNFDPFSLVPELSIPHIGTHYFDWVLSGAVGSDPNRSGYVSDRDVARLLSESRESERNEIRKLDSRSREAWEIHLQALEFRSLSLLDPVATNTLFRELAALAEWRAKFDGDGRELLADYAVSSPPLVSDAYYRELSGEEILEHDRSSLAEVLYRRFVHIGTHLLDPKFLHVHRNFKRLFVALDAPYQVNSCDEVIASIERNRQFFESFPDSVRDFRTSLLSEISAESGGSFYLRVRTWAFGLNKPLRFKHQWVGALLLVDMISQSDDDSGTVSNFSSQLLELPIIPEIAAMAAFAFAGKERYYETMEWISRADLHNPENASLLLRIAAEFRELSPMAVKALCVNSPVPQESSQLALARVRAIVKGLPEALAEEMLGDSESAFGDPLEAFRHYDVAISFGNADALEKSADLAYELGRFHDAEHRYELLLANGWSGEIAHPRLCMAAIERGDYVRAAAYFELVDRTDPSNCAVVASYRFSSGEPFQGLADLSVFPAAVLLDLAPEIRTQYREFAESSVSEISADGSVSISALPSFLLASRSLAYGFSQGVSDAPEYFRTLLWIVRGGEGSLDEDAIESAVIEMLAPIHHPAALELAKEDRNTRKEVLASLLALEVTRFMDAYQNGLSDQGPDRREYSAMLLAASDLLGHFGQDFSGFLREAGADAILGESTPSPSVVEYSKITVH